MVPWEILISFSCWIKLLFYCMSNSEIQGVNRTLLPQDIQINFPSWLIPEAESMSPPASRETDCFIINLCASTSGSAELKLGMRDRARVCFRVFRVIYWYILRLNGRIIPVILLFSPRSTRCHHEPPAQALFPSTSQATRK